MYLEEECFILSFWLRRDVFYVWGLLFRVDSPAAVLKVPRHRYVGRRPAILDFRFMGSLA